MLLEKQNVSLYRYINIRLISIFTLLKHFFYQKKHLITRLRNLKNIKVYLKDLTHCDKIINFKKKLSLFIQLCINK